MLSKNIPSIWLTLLLVCVSSAWAQVPGENYPVDEFQASFISGYFTGGTYAHTRIEGEPVKADADAGWLIGARLGVDNQYLGWEVSLAAVFADMDLSADPAANLPSASDSSLLLADINALWFPTGYGMADGRIRPFFTVGGGGAYFNSDFDKTDNEFMLDVNAGAGIKFLLGDEGNPVLRLDWRWHYLNPAGLASGLDQNIYRQELTVGLGIRF